MMLLSISRSNCKKQRTTQVQTTLQNPTCKWSSCHSSLLALVVAAGAVHPYMLDYSNQQTPPEGHEHQSEEAQTQSNVAQLIYA